MQINIHKENSIVIFSLSGRYDISQVHDFEVEFRKYLEEKPKVIALNLKNLKYIDSSGIGSLVRCMNLSLKNNIKFICYDVNDNIKNIFDIAKLDQFISILTEKEFINQYIKK